MAEPTYVNWIDIPVVTSGVNSDTILLSGSKLITLENLKVSLESSGVIVFVPS